VPATLNTAHGHYHQEKEGHIVTTIVEFFILKLTALMWLLIRDYASNT
jgi:hypothetical protein